MIPSFAVPPRYFYALSAALPAEVSADVRYRLATLADEKAILDQLRKAVEDGVITEDPAVSVEMAARRLRALGTVSGGAVVTASGVGFALVDAYASYESTPPAADPEDDIAPFWAGVMANAAQAAAHLELVLCAVTLEPDSRPMIGRVTDPPPAGEGLTLDDVRNLDPNPWPGPAVPTLGYDDWERVFTTFPGVLPAVTAPGTLDQRIGAFVRRLRQFFDVSGTAAGPMPFVPGAPPTIPPPAFDPLAAFFAAYTAQPGQAGFTWGTPFDPGALDAAIAAVPMDERGRAWLRDAVLTVNDLAAITDVGVDPELRFSLVEALFARGFTRAADVAALSPDDFATALVGTPAWPFAGAIYPRAGGTGGPGTTPTGPFAPVNDGSLADCLPPCGQSPLGVVAYLHDLLALGLQATCDDRSGSNVALAHAVGDRRGDLRDLAATCANAETPIPVVDLVNECLEHMVATGSASGVVRDTARDQLAGLPLRELDQPDDESVTPFGHDPATLFAALPEHSSPAAPAAAPAAYAPLATDFSAPALPYTQELDVNRAYLGAAGTARYDVMRRFRKEIHEFALAPGAAEPADFPRHLWRYPVRIELACEHLLVDPVEYDELYTKTPSGDFLASLYGYLPGDPAWPSKVVGLAELLRRTGLGYCELLELGRSEYVRFHARETGHHGTGAKEAGRGDERRELPDCEPCYLDAWEIVFDDLAPLDALTRLAVFVRLWRTLRERPDGGYSFTELRDICEVLELFDGGGNVNPDFVRQLAAFQLLRDDFALPLRDAGDVVPGTGADRTHLLALWAPWAPNPPRKWQWAVDTLVDSVEPRVIHDEHLPRTEPRPPDFRKVLVDNLTPLSLLAGFDPAVPARTWHARPAHTLRFAEQLAKVWASSFGIGEILYLFTADRHVGGDDPFPLQDENEAHDDPFEHPDQESAHWLWELRERLLATEPAEDDVAVWTWPRVTQALTEDLLIAPGPGLDSLAGLAERFFPSVLEAEGIDVPPARRRFEVPLAGSSAATWNTPPSPFDYDAAAGMLRADLPLTDEAVLSKLHRMRQLQPDEQQAVRDLYALPWLDLARHAYLFPTLADAHVHLVEEADEQRRWDYFRRAVATFAARCRVVAEHLAAHVDSVTGDEGERTFGVAWSVLCRLLADENAATPPPWERDDGTRPPVTWTPQPSGGAFAAILGLVGTGLRAEYTVDDGATVVWRDLRGPVDVFGETRNDWNAPVPTLIPALDADLPLAQQEWARTRNGVALHTSSARRLGGVQPYCVELAGALLVENDGTYQFRAGHPTAENEEPDVESLRGRRWRVTLRRGQKSWVLLTHDWPDAAECAVSVALPLRRGTYDLTIELVGCAPTDDALEDQHVRQAGFQLKYRGPDTGDELVTVPRRRLYVQRKDGTLAEGADDRAGGAFAVLQTWYFSTLRDIRRTYERAFKATLLARRFDLSAEVFADYAQSELGFLLDHPERFAGLAFYDAGGWQPHRVNLDPNLLPLRDPYLTPLPAGDDRGAPSPQRRHALFDQWERLFDHTVLRAAAGNAPEHPTWLLFDEAFENQPDNPAHLLRHLGVDLTHSDGVLEYWNGYTVTADDLVDERWATRVWRADELFRLVERSFYVTDPRLVRPARWAADSPGAPGGGNEDLTRLVREGYVENGPPRRYADLTRLDDRLRERARRALVAYLTGMDRVPLPWGGFATTARDLSDLLLIDVETGLCHRASRVEEAITAVQTFVQRARVGLEPAWTPSAGFVALWDGRYATFRTWEACARRTLYAENWQEWTEREQARRTEAYRFLEDQLRKATLTKPVPGGLEYWDAAELPAHPGLVLLQEYRESTIRVLAGPRQGLALRGQPAADAQRSWLSHLRTTDAPAPDDDKREPQDDKREPQDDEQPVPAAVPRGRTPEGTVIAAERGTVDGVDTAAGTDVTLDTARIAVRERHPRAEPLPVPPGGTVPLWLEAAIRVGTRFIRVAAAGEPPASVAFAPPPARDRDACCHACGCVHDAVVDEYYFWLADRRWYDEVEQVADWPGWYDSAQLPDLLKWPDEPQVHLVWCRVHNGEVHPPRRSVEGVRMPKGNAPGSTELELAGREADSLFLRVVGGVAAPGHLPPPGPGFRYDLVTGEAHVVPAVPAVPKHPAWLGGLSAYPFFAYHDPGAPLFPLSPFSEGMAVASALRALCRYEAALKWYAVVSDPLRGDNGWCPGRHVPPGPAQPGDRVPGDRPADDGAPVGVVVLARGEPARDALPDDEAAREEIAREKVRREDIARDDIAREKVPREDIPREKVPREDIPREDIPRDRVEPHDGLCCRHAGATPEVARRRAVLLEYLDTLLEWADCLLAENTPEAFQQARAILDTAGRILGATPRTVRMDEHDAPHMTVGTFTPAGAPLNPRLVALYERVGDRLSLVRACLNAPRRRNGTPRTDMPYFGNDPARDGWLVTDPGCECGMDVCCCPVSPYRFVVLARRAVELASVVRGLGSGLLLAYEKADAEYLANLRTGHEHQLTTLLRDVRKDQWRDADWQVQALEKAREIAQTNRRYYGMLVTNGLAAGELDYQALTNAAVGALNAATVSEAIGTVLGIIPDIFVGTVNFTQLAIGTKLAQVFQGIARISTQVSQILTTTAGLRITEAGWERREDDWRHQIDLFDLEIEQVERQILGAERRRSAALRELNMQEQSIANAKEVLDTLRTKFTNQELYLWLVRETSALHRGAYDLARCAAEQAERAFNYERGFTARRFLPEESWENLRDGLLAGERLELAVRQMEAAYLTENVREYELVKHVSLRLHAPEAFLALKLTGSCVVELPEWLFDADYPGHYMRRVKTVSLTIPAVVGPYTGVHCRLTLLSSATRVDPRLAGPVAPCCHEEPPPVAQPPECHCWPAPAPKRPAPPPPDETTNGYVARRDDPRIVRQYLATEAIATSTGQADSGLFQLSFSDDRYLPFEFAGAVSRWRVELPPENNRFDLASLSDVVMHVSYTTREGGDVLRAAASEVARAHLPGDGERLFEVRNEMTDEWHRFRTDSGPQRLEVRLGRHMFPFVTSDAQLFVTGFDLLVEARGADPSVHHEVAFVVRHERGCHRAAEDDHDFECVAGAAWPGLFHGSVDVEAGPLTGSDVVHLGTFRFEDPFEDVSRIFLVVRYEQRRAGVRAIAAHTH